MNKLFSVIAILILLSGCTIETSVSIRTKQQDAYTNACKPLLDIAKNSLDSIIVYKERPLYQDIRWYKTCLELEQELKRTT